MKEENGRKIHKCEDCLWYGRCNDGAVREGDGIQMCDDFYNINDECGGTNYIDDKTEYQNAWYEYINDWN